MDLLPQIILLNDLERCARLAKVEEDIIAELAEIARDLKNDFLAALRHKNGLRS